MASDSISQWNGEELIKKARRATGRGFVGIAGRIESQGKRFVDVISGDLKRSIHVARSGTSGNGPIRGGNDAQAPGSNDAWLVEVGSWLDYACVEEVGRGHQFMQPAVESTSGGPAYAIMKQAWEEEGL